MRTGWLSMLLLALATPAAAKEFQPGVIFDVGGIFDKSFNEGIHNGVERFKAETGIGYRQFELTNETQREQFMREMARRGADVVLVVGFSQASALARVAPEFPATKFTLIDSVVDKPNVQSVVFREQEGSYLVGMLAALKTATGKIGFVGGMDIPLIRKFACGYEQGAHAVTPDLEVFQNMTGATPAAWRDPTRGAELALSQFDRGADVIFAAAGTTGLGVLQAAADRGRFAIGVDSNQNHLHPGHVLTSMLKRVDVVAYDTFKQARDGSWKPGTVDRGLAEGGIGWALDDNNKALISDAMKARVDAAAADIVAGRIHVIDYAADKACKY